MARMESQVHSTWAWEHRIALKTAKQPCGSSEAVGTFGKEGRADVLLAGLGTVVEEKFLVFSVPTHYKGTTLNQNATDIFTASVAV